MEKGSWKAILEASEPSTALAWESIQGIWASLLLRRSHPLGIRQHCEMALLSSYVGRIKEPRAWPMRALNHLNAAIRSAGSDTSPALYGGLSGLGWTTKHVFDILRESKSVERPSSRHFVATELGDGQLHEEISNFLFKNLRARLDTGRYELLTGIVGFGVYLLERRESDCARQSLELIVGLLAKSAEYSEKGVCWHTPSKFLPAFERAKCPGGYYNLGVAHGIPGALFLLAEIRAAGIQRDLAGELLNEGVKWLMNVENDRSPTRFELTIPSFAPSPPRLAWCYNDLGVAAVMLQVSRCTGSELHRAFGRGLLDHCLSIASQLRSSSAGLCHGAASVAHIMNRIFQLDNDRRCLDLALHYYQRVLALRKPGMGIAGYYRLIKSSDGTLRPDANVGFLDGALGIALALLAAVTPVEPRWDRLMLLSSSH